MSDWNETKDIMHEVSQLFQRNDDIDDVNDIHKMGREIESCQMNNIKDLKEKIKGFN